MFMLRQKEVQDIAGKRSPSRLLVRQDFTDEDLALLYGILKNDGSLKTIFWMGAPSLTDFLQAYGPHNAALLQFGDENCCPRQVLGLGWVNSTRRINLATEDRTVEVGFGIRKSARKLKDTLSFGRSVLQIAFDKSPHIIAAVGVTPEKNTGAVMFARLLGMQISGPVPNYASWDGIPCGAYISCMTREAFYGGQ